jgi:hypothetical protein
VDPDEIAPKPRLSLDRHYHRHNHAEEALVSRLSSLAST